MTAAGAREQVRVEIERYVSAQRAEQEGLVREHLQSLRDEEAFRAAGFCYAAALALEAPSDVAMTAARGVGFIEAAVSALRSVTTAPEGGEVARAEGLPLALNAADALYSLGHMSLVELMDIELRGRAVVARRSDELSAAIWDASLPGETPFAEGGGVERAILRLAGEVAGLVAGRGGNAAAALGEFAAKHGSEELPSAEFGEAERTRLKALL